MNLGDWDNVRIFLAAAETQSLRGAALALETSQPTVGRKIDELETSLGVQLFLRSREGLVLTESGKRFLGVARRMAETAAQLRQCLEPDDALTGVVRFSASDGVCGYWLPPLLAEFHTTHPNITVEITSRESGHMPDLSRLETDITIVYREPTDPDVVVIARSVMEMGFCAARSYVETYGVPTSIADLRQHRICAHDMHFQRIGLWDEFADLLADHPSVTCRTNSSMTLGYALLYGVGVSLQPISITEREPTLVPLPFEGFTPKLPFWLVCHRDTKNKPRIRALIEHLKRGLCRAQSVPGSMTWVAPDEEPVAD